MIKQSIIDMVNVSRKIIVISPEHATYIKIEGKWFEAATINNKPDLSFTIRVAKQEIINGLYNKLKRKGTKIIFYEENTKTTFHGGN